MDQYLTVPWGSKSNIVRVKIRDKSLNNGTGKNGIDFDEIGLKISIVSDVQAAPTVYEADGSQTEPIATIGTYVAPSPGKVRWGQVDGATNKGLYEIQFDDAVFAVPGAQATVITISGVADAEQTDVRVDLYGGLDAALGAALKGRVLQVVGNTFRGSVVIQ